MLLHQSVDHLLTIVRHLLEQVQLAVVGGLALHLGDLIFILLGVHILHRHLDAGVDVLLVHILDIGQRLVDNGDNRKQHQHLHQHGQTAAGHLDALFLVQLLLLEHRLLAVLRVLLLNALQTGCQTGAIGLVLLILNRQREQNQSGEHGEDQQSQKIAGDELINPLHQHAQRACKQTKQCVH